MTRPPSVAPCGCEPGWLDALVSTAEATGANEVQVFDAFSVLSEQCLENLGELYRMNCDSVKGNLAALADSFGATLVSRD